MYAYIDRKKKLPVTTLLRAIGYESDRTKNDPEAVKKAQEDIKIYNDLLERQEFSGTKLPNTPRLIKGGRSGKQIPDTSNLGPSGSTQVFGELSDDNIA